MGNRSNDNKGRRWKKGRNGGFKKKGEGKRGVKKGE